MQLWSCGNHMNVKQITLLGSQLMNARITNSSPRPRFSDFQTSCLSLRVLNRCSIYAVFVRSSSFASPLCRPFSPHTPTSPILRASGSRRLLFSAFLEISSLPCAWHLATHYRTAPGSSRCDDLLVRRSHQRYLPFSQCDLEVDALLSQLTFASVFGELWVVLQYAAGDGESLFILLEHQCMIFCQSFSLCSATYSQIQHLRIVSPAQLAIAITISLMTGKGLQTPPRSF